MCKDNGSGNGIFGDVDESTERSNEHMHIVDAGNVK